MVSCFLRRMSIFEDGRVHALRSQKERLAPDAKPRPVLAGLSPKFLDLVASKFPRRWRIEVCEP